MSKESRMLAGVLLVVLPSVMYGGLTLLIFLLRYVDEALLSPFWKWLARVGADRRNFDPRISKLRRFCKSTAASMD